MMKKNYFGMIVAAAMMFAGFSLTSCSENDVAIIDGEVWVKPEVQLTDDGAIVKGSSPSDISRMISRVKNEISAAAEAGKSFKISVEASAINSTSADNAISIPTLKNSDIVLSFSNPIQTEVPLVLKSKGAGDDAKAEASTNKLEIDIPSGSSKMDMELIFPTSTVTLKGGAINKVTALTAYNTMIIESGVTIEWLKMKKNSRAEVKDGGKVLGYMRDGSESDGGTDVFIDSAGVQPVYAMYGPDVYFMKDEVEKPYYTEKLKEEGFDSNGALVIINPPYGERLAQDKDVLRLYSDMGKALKFQFTGATAWVISSNEEALKCIGLKPSKKIHLLNGELDCLYNQYELFQGEHKEWKKTAPQKDKRPQPNTAVKSKKHYDRKPHTDSRVRLSSTRREDRQVPARTKRPQQTARVPRRDNKRG